MLLMLLLAQNSIVCLTWLFSGASQNSDSIIYLIALVHKDSEIADVTFFFKVYGSTVLLKAYIGALDVIPETNLDK